MNWRHLVVGLGPEIKTSSQDLLIVAAPQDPVTEGRKLDTQNPAAPAIEGGVQVGMVGAQQYLRSALRPLLQLLARR